VTEPNRKLTEVERRCREGRDPERRAKRCVWPSRPGWPREAMHVTARTHLVSNADRHNASCYWYCIVCHEFLATGWEKLPYAGAEDVPRGGRPDREGAVHLLDILQPLHAERYMMPAFGPPDSMRLRGRRARTGSGRTWSLTAHVLPIYVYCPRADCGAGQIIRSPEFMYPTSLDFAVVE